MTLQDVLTIVWRRRWIVLLLAIIGGTAAWFAGGTTEASSVTYQAETTFTLTPEEDPRSVDLYAFIANETPEIWSLVAAGYGDDIPGNVTVDAIDAIGAIRIVATGQPSEDTARTIVNLFATEISDYGANQRIVDRDNRLARLTELEEDLRGTIQELDRELTALENSLAESEQAGNRRGDQLKQTELDAASDALATILRERAELTSRTDDELRPFEPIGLIIVDTEEVAADPLGRRGRVAVGISLGALLGLALAFGLHRFDARLFTRRDAEAAYSLPVMAEIPKISWRKRRGHRIITHENPTHKAAEAYRVLRSGIARARAVQLTEPTGPVTDNGAVVLVTSASADVGKTSTVANLAVAATDAGATVLVVSGDLRQPTIHQYFDVDPSAVGLSDAASQIRQGKGAALDTYVVRTNVMGVSFLPHGSLVVNPGEILADARSLLDEARSQFDLVLVDSPPMLAGNDVDEMLPSVDLVLQVARAGRTTIDEGFWTDETIQRRQTPTCGLVLIGARSDLERRSSARRTGLWAKLGSVFGRSVGQTGKIAWGSKSMPQVATPPPIEAGASHHSISEGQTTLWPIEYDSKKGNAPDADQADDAPPDFAVTQQFVLPLPPPSSATAKKSNGLTTAKQTGTESSHGQSNGTGAATEADADESNHTAETGDEADSTGDDRGDAEPEIGTAPVDRVPGTEEPDDADKTDSGAEDLAEALLSEYGDNPDSGGPTAIPRKPPSAGSGRRSAS